MNYPFVSIMMPAYNAERFIQQAIDSVLAQNYPHWELIVVDDGSTDSTRAIAESYADARIRVFHQANAGEAAARNHALRQMSGDLLAFVDADDTWLPDHLALTAGSLAEHSELDAVYTDGWHIDTHGNRLPSLASRRRGPFEGDLFDAIVRASDVFGPPLCVVLRRSLVVERGLWFDPEIVIGPDWDFFTRVCETARFGYIDRQTCEYRIHQTNITVQVDLKRRAGYLQRCREKAIALSRFDECSIETRTEVFYDLLVNLLDGQPEQQAAVFGMSQFGQLPPFSQARLLRLAATAGLSTGGRSPHYTAWLHQARRLYPADMRSRVLDGLQRLHPALLHLALRLLRRFRPPPAPQAPFGDIQAAKTRPAGPPTGLD
jgi:glycosyltransferase involved in cell wall biosynthesis